jgi:hypothetical protein
VRLELARRPAVLRGVLALRLVALLREAAGVALRGQVVEASGDDPLGGRRRRLLGLLLLGLDLGDLLALLLEVLLRLADAALLLRFLGRILGRRVVRRRGLLGLLLGRAAYRRPGRRR